MPKFNRRQFLGSTAAAAAFAAAPAIVQAAVAVLIKAYIKYSS